MRYWEFTNFSRMSLVSSRGDVCLMGDNLYHIYYPKHQNYYPKIEFFGCFGIILAIRLVETFIDCLNS
jgi:hypothetical protein